MKESTQNRISNGFKLTDLMIFKVRWWQHLIFWGLALLILLNIFKSSSSLEKIDVIYTLIFLVPIVGIVYLNLYLVIPKFLRRERYFIFIMLFLALVGGGAVMLYFLFGNMIDLVLPSYYFISYYSVPVLMIYTGSFLLLTTLLKLSRSWFMLLRVDRISTGHQLKSLQSQINPHFLLNSLQTIYALSLERSEHTPKVILQLSEILKYTLYETAQSRVKLEKEIGLIRDYVEMHRHRVDPARVEIKLEIDGDPGDGVIAPMLLLPFIENSFKHGLQGRPDEAFVHIGIKMVPGKFAFRIENNLGTADPVDHEKNKGIGIENTRQRLALLYPGNHNLSIKKNKDIFKVNLELKLND